MCGFCRRGKLKLENFRELVTNDFEKPVMDEFQAIGSLKGELYEMGADFALMSGSGSSIFAIFEKYDLAEKTRTHYKDKYFTFLQNSN